VVLQYKVFSGKDIPVQNIKSVRIFRNQIFTTDGWLVYNGWERRKEGKEERKEEKGGRKGRKKRKGKKRREKKKKEEKRRKKKKKYSSRKEGRREESKRVYQGREERNPTITEGETEERKEGRKDEEGGKRKEGRHTERKVKGKEKGISRKGEKKLYNNGRNTRGRERHDTQRMDV
jgi:hypothetical protein